MCVCARVGVRVCARGVSDDGIASAVGSVQIAYIYIAITCVVEGRVLKKRVLLRKVWCVRSACVVCRLFESRALEDQNIQ